MRSVPTASAAAMSGELRVSVVVPVLNGADVIGDLLTSLRHQTSRAAAEVIVVDNASTDATVDVVRRFPVALLSEPRRGPSAARNRGLQHARGEVVVFLDADVLPTRNWLAEMTAPFSDPALVVAGGRSVDYLPTTPAQRFIAQLGIRQLEYDFFRGNVPYVAGENMAVRRSALEAVGGWDESFYTAEDLDLCVRLMRRFDTLPLRRPHAVLFSRRRSTFDALFRQAWNYGQGLGRVHLRHPGVIPLDAARWSAAASILAARCAKASLFACGRTLGWIPPAQAEFARHHWNWSRRFWGGFVSMLRNREWRPR
ncbi:MAG: glycosyltransferase [Deltaproteobacteria bacterium]|nr:glycosyltransferase [Deltaproteobacteria bacterium]